jgi:hypothetical protein
LKYIGTFYQKKTLKKEVSTNFREKKNLANCGRKIVFLPKVFLAVLLKKNKSKLIIVRAGHSLLFTLFANRYSATSMYHFAIATPLLF